LRLDRTFESIDGHFTAMELDLREPLDLDTGEIKPVEMLLGEYSPSAHLTDDFFQNKFAFVVLLNFPHYSLDEMQKLGPGWNDTEWAKVRMGDMFRSRVPAELNQEIAKVAAAADAYINEYNIHMATLRDRDNKQLFPEGLKLISHWGLRDELKSHYGRPDGVAHQEIIFEVMKRIITQEIPKAAINKSDVIWNPYTNTISQNGEFSAAEPEPDQRYQQILDYFHVIRKIDRYYPHHPTYIQRIFELDREMPEKEVEKLFADFLSAPQFGKVAQLIQKRLGRKLCPYDIWYDGFKARTSIPEEKLDKIVLQKYPTLAAFQRDIPNLLLKLGFSGEQAAFIAPHIQVDPARGAGHAAPALMPSAKSRLRTRGSADGMDYKGFNIGAHELGHTIEQTLSLHKVPHHLNQGVPFTGFSEAFAFLFQNRDMELLGMPDTDPLARHLLTLDQFWGACEIMGVALVDMQVWNWLYAHPEANASQLKAATISAAKEKWNRFFAPAFGAKDEIILGIYSHMIAYPLYLAEYPLGHLIEFQIEKHMEGKNFGVEMERLCAAGNVIPQVWMKKGVGSELSGQPMLSAVDQALAAVSN